MYSNSVKKPSTTAPLEYDRYYHIYNRGINGCKLFYENNNYEHFLRLYTEYITPVADTYAWVLMGNHFHFLVRIKAENEIPFMPIPEGAPDGSFVADKRFKPSSQFGHLFNAYAKAFNKRYERTGSLLEKPFRRIQVSSDQYFKRLVYYIHNNPVHHNFVDHMIEYPWSSYLTIVSEKPTRIDRKAVLEWFGDNESFVEFHGTDQNVKSIEHMVIEED